jgi:hypothetical protein
VSDLLELLPPGSVSDASQTQNISNLIFQKPAQTLDFAGKIFFDF